MVDILASGTAASEHVDKLEEVKQVFGMLGVDASLVCCQLEDIDMRNVFKQDIKLDHSTEGSEVSLSEGTIKVEIAVKLEDKEKEDTCEPEALSEISSKRETYNVAESSKITEDPNYMINPHPQCCECGKRFSSKGGLKQHMKGVHSERRFQCNLCQQNFSQKPSLKIHIDSVHNNMKHQCNICPQKFAYKNYLKLHIDSVHNKIKVPCHLCPKKFTQPSSLKTHIDAVHKKIQFPC